MLLGSTGDIAYANNEGWNSFSYRRYASVFGRLNYEYDDKYFLTATLREMVLRGLDQHISLVYSQGFLVVGKYIKKHFLETLKT